MATKTETTPFVDNSDSYNRQIQAVPAPEKEIGIDTKDFLYQNIINAGNASALNAGALESMTTVASGRDQLYRTLEIMADDPKLSAVLETYAEDATEYNDRGQIVWVESSNPDISAFVTFLLKTLRVDKNIYKWTYSLCKYGDLYLRLYRNSEYNDLIFKPYDDSGRLFENLEKSIDENKNTDQNRLNETIKLKAYAKSDKYVKYVEMVDNPAEVFELTRFGKTAGYIKADLPFMATKTDSNNFQITNISGYYRYRFKQRNVSLFPATEFVHACLDDNTSRTPEEVDIFIDNPDTIARVDRDWREYSNDVDYNSSSDGDFSGTSMSYKVKTGQSILYNSYKVWRELSLLESSVLLSRVTQSSIIRLLQINVADMPKESVGPHLRGVKELIEQHASINVGQNMNEYTNPGPLINTVYVPVHGDVGTISTQVIGGDYDPKSLADLDYYNNNLYGTLRVPKQYFSQTDDSTGFNGGTSLSIISSRYAKAIKRIQNTIIQMLTDMINLMLLDADLGNYINQFTLKMLPPTTQEEKDRRENIASRIQHTRDVMDLMDIVDEPILKLKTLKSLLSSALQDQEISELLQEEIDKLKAESDEALQEEDEVEDSDSFSSDVSGDFDSNEPLGLTASEPASDEPSAPVEMEMPEMPSSDDSNSLPSPSDLGIDATDSTQF